jgi:hypothetical protein
MSDEERRTFRASLVAIVLLGLITWYCSGLPGLMP